MRAKTSPQLLRDGKAIISSAQLISMKTGLPAMGKGCQQFLLNAPEKVLNIKANVDVARAQIIAQMAKSKNNNKAVNHFRDIPKTNRIGQRDIDTATISAFKSVLGHSEKQAKAALKTLKKKPCQVY